MHRSLMRFGRSVLALDMAIAAEAYHEQKIVRLRSSLATLREKVRKDPLTGLASREHIQAHLAASCDAATVDAPAAVVVADLDRFKQVNDTFGHLVGDEVLQETARRIASGVREGDLVGRWGGEEFLLVLRESDARDAMRAAERVRRSVHDTPIQTSAGEIALSISQGVAVTAGGEDPRSLIERADRAMYEAKGRGRNRVVGPEDVGRPA
jgi:two-component system cell cycle response regulator